MSLEFSLSLLGLIPLVAYLLNRWLFSPRIFFYVAGEQHGLPIKIRESGHITFMVGTRSKHRVLLQEVWVQADGYRVSLQDSDAARPTADADWEYPVALKMESMDIIGDKYMQAFQINYDAHASEFTLKFRAISKVDDTNLPPILDMIPPRLCADTRLVRFVVVDDPPEAELVLKPGESVKAEGPLAQQVVSARSDKSGAKLQVIENGTKKEISL